MAARRRAIELWLEVEDRARLEVIAQSRTEPAGRVERARILLAYPENPSFFAVARALGLHRQTVQRCVERAVVEGPIAALDDRPRPGRPPTITLEAKAWLASLACQKAKELGCLAIPTNWGRRGFWRVMRASMHRGRAMPALPIWRKVRCARSSARTM